MFIWLLVKYNLLLKSKVIVAFLELIHWKKFSSLKVAGRASP